MGTEKRLGDLDITNEVEVVFPFKAKAETSCGPRKKRQAIVASVVLLAAVAVAVTVFLLTRKDDDSSTDSQSLKHTSIEAVVKGSTPAVLVANNESSRHRRHVCRDDGNDGPDCRTTKELILSRMFSEGPSHYTARVRSVDDEVEGIAQRIAGATYTIRCLNDPVQTWRAPAFPTGDHLDMYLSCFEIHRESDSAEDHRLLAFGTYDGIFSVAMVQKARTNAEMNGAIYANVHLDGSYARVWQVVSKSYTEASWMEIVANKTADTIRVKFASTEQATTGIGCGIELWAENELIAVDGIFADQDCQNQSAPLNESGSYTTVCFDSDLNETNITNCEGNFTMPVMQMTALSSAEFAHSAHDQVASFASLNDTGLRDFGQ